MQGPGANPFRLPSTPELARIALEYHRHRIDAGETVGVFRVVDVLDRQGNVSTVYRAEATVDVPPKGIRRGSRFIVKGIPFRPSTSASTNARNLRSFFNEIRVLPFVPNPKANNIVRLVDANGFPARGKLYMVFEELAYQSVREKYTDKRLDPEIALGFARSLTRALMHLHSLGIVHGDVKPDNFMIDLGGEAVLVDFGSAFFSGRKSTTRRRQPVQPPDPDEYRDPFTPLYCSPELARYKLYGGVLNPKDEASDAWSLGVTLWELLVGERPFTWMQNETLSAILEELGRGTAPVRLEALGELAAATPHRAVAGTYRFLQNLIRRFLVPDPLRRLSCFEAHAEILTFLGPGRKPTAVKKAQPQAPAIDRLEVARKIAQLEEEPKLSPEEREAQRRGRATAAIELKTLELRDAYMKGQKRSASGIRKGWFTPPVDPAAGAPAPPAPAPPPAPKPPPAPRPAAPAPEGKGGHAPLTFEEFARRRKDDEIHRMKRACEEGSSTQWGSDTRVGEGPGAEDLGETAVDEDTRVYPAFPGDPDASSDADGSSDTRVDPLQFRKKPRSPMVDPEATQDE